MLLSYHLLQQELGNVLPAPPQALYARKALPLFVPCPTEPPPEPSARNTYKRVPFVPFETRNPARGAPACGGMPLACPPSGYVPAPNGTARKPGKRVPFVPSVIPRVGAQHVAPSHLPASNAYSINVCNLRHPLLHNIYNSQRTSVPRTQGCTRCAITRNLLLKINQIVQSVTIHPHTPRHSHHAPLRRFFATPA